MFVLNKAARVESPLVEFASLLALAWIRQRF
jgi:hypothetical protein